MVLDLLRRSINPCGKAGIKRAAEDAIHGEVVRTGNATYIHQRAITELHYMRAVDAATNPRHNPKGWDDAINTVGMMLEQDRDFLRRYARE